MADPFAMLEADHRQVERMLAELAETEPGPEREELVQRLTSALTLHMDFEESSVYPLMQEVDGDSAREAEIEHDLAREGLSKLSALMSEPGFGAVVAMVEAGIGHHVEEEEGEMFPELRQQVDGEQQASLARQLITAKRDAGMLVASLEDASKDDLVEIAETLGLEAKSSMTKDQLRELVGTATT